MQVLLGLSFRGNSKSNDALSQFFNTNKSLDYYFVGRITVSYKKWYVHGDVYGRRFHNATEFSYKQTPLIDVTLFLTMPRLIAGYKAFGMEFKHKRTTTKLEIWPYVGVRFYFLNLRNNYNNVIDEFNINSIFIDPTVGFSINMRVNKFIVLFENDFGGFRVGSDLTYWFQLSGGYEIVKFFAIQLGWMYQNINYSENIQNNMFNVNIKVQGPLLGIIFKF